MDADDQIFFIFGLIVMALFLAVSLMKVSELAQQDDVKAKFHIEEVRNAIETLDVMHGYVTLPYSTGEWENYGLMAEREEVEVIRDDEETIRALPRLRLSIGEKADTFESERGGYDEMRTLILDQDTEIAGEFEFRSDFRIAKDGERITLDPFSARCPDVSPAEEEWTDLLEGLRSDADVRVGPHIDRERPSAIMIFVSDPTLGCEEFARAEQATRRLGTAVTRSVLSEEHFLRISDEQVLVVIR